MAARPGSLLARTNAVLGVGAVAIAFTAIVSLNQFVISPIAERSADDEAGLLVLAAKTWVELDPERRPYFELELAENHDLVISAETRDLPIFEHDIVFFDLLEAKLNQRLPEPAQLMTGDTLIWANVPMGGYELQIGFSPERRDIEPLLVGLVIVIIGALIVFGTSFFIVRRVAGPLGETAEAAAAFRGAEGFTPLPEKGPEELVTLAQSFNTMAREITELLSNRTTLLAGISHDLRTPLARMRLALELLPDNVDAKLRSRFERNLEAMDELIGDALKFARGAGEAPQVVEFKPYIESTVHSLDEKLDIDWDGPEDIEVNIAVGAFRRVLINLISNAERHALGARVAVRVRDIVEVHVIDLGPGIPADEREKVFQPFYRLDSSRSTGGSGLGLAIVHQLCQAHGWTVDLTATDEGGTDARVRLSRGMLARESPAGSGIGVVAEMPERSPSTPRTASR